MSSWRRTGHRPTPDWAGEPARCSVLLKKRPPTSGAPRSETLARFANRPAATPRRSGLKPRLRWTSCAPHSSRRSRSTARACSPTRNRSAIWPAVRPRTCWPPRSASPTGCTWQPTRRPPSCAPRSPAMPNRHGRPQTARCRRLDARWRWRRNAWPAKPRIITRRRWLKPTASSKSPSSARPLRNSALARRSRRQPPTGNRPSLSRKPFWFAHDVKPSRSSAPLAPRPTRSRPQGPPRWSVNSRP